MGRDSLLIALITVLVTYLEVMIKYLTNSNSREERLSLVYSLS